MIRLDSYNYNLPKSRIALKPVRPRDTAKLLVYDHKKKTVHHDTFRNLAKHLPKNALLVVNNTKVIPARLTVTKPTGGKVELFYLATEGKKIKVLLNARLPVGTKISLGKLSFTISQMLGKEYLVTPSFPISKLPTILARYGHIPLPPYLKQSPLAENERRREYQTVFARESGSVAASTASLHFTKELIKKCKQAGIEFAEVTLSVGLGTFAPVTDEHLKTGKLHEEAWSLSSSAAKKINAAKKEGRPIIAVGTTALRTLESAALSKGRVRAQTGETQLFIRPGYAFKIVNGLITNFHVPRSSLLMLVAALIGREKLLGLYKTAIKKRYRFFSFGDGILLRSCGNAD